MNDEQGGGEAGSSVSELITAMSSCRLYDFIGTKGRVTPLLLIIKLRLHGWNLYTVSDQKRSLEFSSEGYNPGVWGRKSPNGIQGRSASRGFGD